jgi:hypothetical protein
MNQTGRAKRPGRPSSGTPKKGTGGKGRVLSANISQETRDWLEIEAERTGRSLSQIAERWLDEARKGNTTVEHLMGGYGLVPVMMKLGEIARAVEDSGLEPEFRRDAIIAAWSHALDLLLPYAPDPGMRRIEEEIGRFRKACTAVLKAVDTAGADDPVYQAALRPTRMSAKGVLGLVRHSGPSVAARINEFAEGGVAWMSADLCLDFLMESGPTAAAQIADAKASADIVVKLMGERIDAKTKAKDRGVKIALREVGLPQSLRESA